MIEVIEDLLANLEASDLTIQTPELTEADALRTRVVAQVKNHLIPRLRDVAAPVLVVVGGSTGAGKSTLVNSIAGEEVSRAGVLRPTTRQPVLVIHPLDQRYLTEHPVVDLAHVVHNEQIPRGLGLLDAPDLDSVQASNRDLAQELIELADLWVFVTTGARYGDAVPWERLRSASERGVSLAVLLNRVDRQGLIAVRRDLFQRLQDQGFGSVPLFIVPDVGAHEGLLDPKLVGEWGDWLKVLGAQSQSRAVIARTVTGAWPSLRRDVQNVAQAVETQHRLAVGLRGSLRAAVQSTAEQIATDLESGTAAVGAPTTAWLATASSGGPLAPLAASPSGLLEKWRARRSVAERGQALRDLHAVTMQSVRTLIAEAGAASELAVRRALSQADGGDQLLQAVPGDATSAREGRIDELFTTWEQNVRAATTDMSGSGVDIDDDGRRLLCQTAAAGVQGAQAAVERLYGSAGAAAVARLTTDLAGLAKDAVTAEAEPYQQALAGLGIDGATAGRLRLRASELRGYE